MLVRLKLEQSQVKLQIKEAEENLFVYVDKGQIQQALLNLMLNALVVMPGGGEIILEISKYEDGKVQVLIKDTGTGIPIDLQERILILF